MFKLIKKTTFVFISIAILAIILIVVFIIMPSTKKTAATYKDYKTKTQQITSLNQNIDQLKQANQDYQQVKDLADKIDQYIPSTADIPDLVIQLETLAKDTGNQFPNFTVTTPTAASTQNQSSSKASSWLRLILPAFAQTATTASLPAYQKIDIQISLQGTFQNLQDYLAKFSTLSRYAGISSVTISAGATSSGSSSSATATPAANASPALTSEIKAYVYARAGNASSATATPTASPTATNK